MVKIKKLRKFDEAVTMVIGVALMLTILVAISSVVYLSIHGLASNNVEEIPRLEFHINEKNDRLVLFKTDTIIEWKEISIRSTAPVTILINGEVDESTTNDLTANELVEINNNEFINQDNITKNIDASDFIDIEGTDGTILKHVTISLVHKDTNTVIGSFNFNDITGQDTSSS
jgi:hypothetical protein